MRYSNHAANPASLAIEISPPLGCRFKRFWYKVVAVKLEPISALNKPVTVSVPARTLVTAAVYWA
jgi:hypothetical protein